jgi:hypothetical protein
MTNTAGGKDGVLQIMTNTVDGKDGVLQIMTNDELYNIKCKLIELMK